VNFEAVEKFLLGISYGCPVPRQLAVADRIERDSALSRIWCRQQSLRRPDGKLSSLPTCWL